MLCCCLNLSRGRQAQLRPFMRITGGTLRSRILIAPRGSATRPTADRVREALFSILASRIDIDGAHVLDLYAGTGSLSFEALSRGAASVTLVEHARAAVEAIRANADALGVAGRVKMHAITVERALAHLAGSTFDLIFADPPYAMIADGAVPSLLSKLRCADLLTEDGVLVLEHASLSASPPIDNLRVDQTRVYGDTSLAFYVREGAQ